MSQDAPRFSPVIALLAVSAMWEGQLAAILKDLGITTRKFGLLGHIYAEPGISFSELARRSHITVQSAHTAVRTLVDEGLVEKRRGRGMFVTPGARVSLMRDEREKFLAMEWPRVLSRIERLGLNAGDLLKK